MPYESFIGVNVMDTFVLIRSFLLVFDCLSESLLEQRQLRHQIGNCAHVSIFRRIVGGGLDADNKFVLKRMRKFIAGEENSRVFEQLTKKFKI